MTNKIAFIGGAASGVITLAYFLREWQRSERQPVDITVFDPRGFNPGLAYSCSDTCFSLNQPAGKDMNPFHKGGAGLPDSFHAWLSETYPLKHYTEQSFASRCEYGHYLGYIADWVVAKAKRLDGISLHIERQAVQRLATEAGRYTLTATNGRQVQVDDVVLATGHGYQPKVSHPLYLPAYEGPDFGRKLQTIADSVNDVVLIGAGASAIDVIGALESKGFRGNYNVYSPHGNTCWPYDQSATAPIGIHCRWLRKICASFAADPYRYGTPAESLRHSFGQALRTGIAPQFVLQSLRSNPAVMKHKHLRDVLNAAYDNPLSKKRFREIQSLRLAGRVLFHHGKVEKLSPINDFVLAAEICGQAQSLTTPVIDNSVVLRGVVTKDGFIHNDLIRKLNLEKVIALNENNLLDHNPRPGFWAVGPSTSRDNGIETFSIGYAHVARGLAKLPQPPSASVVKPTLVAVLAC